MVGFLLGQTFSSLDNVRGYDDYYGVWQGTGLIDYQGATVESHLVLILNESESRVSIANYLEGESFAMDASVTIRDTHSKHVYFDLSNRTTNGLESFVEVTGIQVPNFPLLFHIESFRLEDNALFLTMNHKNKTLASYRVTRIH